MQSGSVFNPWANGHQDNELYSQILNLNTSDDKTILETLSQLSAEELLSFQVKLNYVSVCIHGITLQITSFLLGHIKWKKETIRA